MYIYTFFQKKFCISKVNSLWPYDTILWHRSGSTLDHVKTCCLMAPRHYLSQCWLIISKVQWHSAEDNFIKIPQPSIAKIHLKITYLKLHSNLPGASELIRMFHFNFFHVSCNNWNSDIKELDESTARRQLKSPRSLSGRSIHLTLVTKWSWSWSWMTYCHPLCAMSIGPPILRCSYFKIWPWKSMVKVMCGQRSGSLLTSKIQRWRLWSRSNLMVTFEALSSIDMFAFHFVAIRPFLAEI